MARANGGVSPTGRSAARSCRTCSFGGRRRRQCGSVRSLDVEREPVPHQAALGESPGSRLRCDKARSRFSRTRESQKAACDGWSSAMCVASRRAHVGGLAGVQSGLCGGQLLYGPHRLWRADGSALLRYICCAPHALYSAQWLSSWVELETVLRQEQWHWVAARAHHASREALPALRGSFLFS